jgi:hypothetical protein
MPVPSYVHLHNLPFSINRPRVRSSRVNHSPIVALFNILLSPHIGALPAGPSFSVGRIWISVGVLSYSGDVLYDNCQVPPVPCLLIAPRRPHRKFHGRTTVKQGLRVSLGAYVNKFSSTTFFFISLSLCHFLMYLRSRQDASFSWCKFYR